MTTNHENKDSFGRFPVLCVTNRALCPDGFLEQIERIVAAQPAGILLREKDLDEAAYHSLAREVAGICRTGNVPLVVHSHASVARHLECRYLHMTLPALEALSASERANLTGAFELSTSCHSVDDAQIAAALGCKRIIAGHIYETDSKLGLQPRGLTFLKGVCDAVSLPVWAIGGIAPQRFGELADAGAAGACMMSAFMREQDSESLRVIAGHSFTA